MTLHCACWLSLFQVRLALPVDRVNPMLIIDGPAFHQGHLIFSHTHTFTPFLFPQLGQVWELDHGNLTNPLAGLLLKDGLAECGAASVLPGMDWTGIRCNGGKATGDRSHNAYGPHYHTLLSRALRLSVLLL